MLYYGLEWSSLDSYMQWREITAPDTPPASEIRQYASDSSGVSTMCWKDDAGQIKCLPPTAGTIPVGTGSTGAVAFWSGTNTLGADASHLFWDDTNDQLLIGIASGSHLGTDSGLLVDENSSNSIIGTAVHSATPEHTPAIDFLRSRGTHASQTIVSSGDRLMRLVALGYDGAAYRDSAAIDAEVDNTPGSSDMPGRLLFYTTPDGSATLSERMRIDSAGLVSIGGFAPDFRLSLRGTTNATGNIAYRYAAADATGPGIALNKFRGSFGAEAATQLDDLLGTINFGGWTNAEKFNAARLEARAGSLWSGTNAESYLLFQTTPSGSLTRAERFRIGAEGQFGIGGAVFGTTGQYFRSGGSGAAPSWATIDHGTELTGLTDDDHTQYVLVTNLEADRATIVTNWDDLTDGGETTLHTHPGGGGGLTHPQVLARISMAG